MNTIDREDMYVKINATTVASRSKDIEMVYVLSVWLSRTLSLFDLMLNKNSAAVKQHPLLRPPITDYFRFHTRYKSLYNDLFLFWYYISSIKNVKECNKITLIKNNK